jgi:hypothetical protein
VNSAQGGSGAQPQQPAKGAKKGAKPKS